MLSINKMTYAKIIKRELVNLSLKKGVNIQIIEKKIYYLVDLTFILESNIFDNHIYAYISKADDRFRLVQSYLSV